MMEKSKLNPDEFTNGTFTNGNIEGGAYGNIASYTDSTAADNEVNEHIAR
jgi:hypothetical protein